MKLDISYKEGCAEVSVDGKPVPGLLSFTLDCRGYMEPCIFTPVIDLSWGSEVRLNSIVDKARSNIDQSIQRE